MSLLRTHRIIVVLTLPLLSACGLGAAPEGGYGTNGGLGLFPPILKPSEEFLRWQGSVNGQDVLDANGEVVRFTAAKPHFLVYGSTAALDLDLTREGLLRRADAPIGMVALTEDIAGNSVAVLVNHEGVPYDVVLEAGEVVLR